MDEIWSSVGDKTRTSGETIETCLGDVCSGCATCSWEATVDSLEEKKLEYILLGSVALISDSENSESVVNFVTILLNLSSITVSMKILSIEVTSIEVTSIVVHSIEGLEALAFKIKLKIQIENIKPPESISGFCNETTGRVRKSLNRKLNNRFQDITVRFIFNI